MKRKLLALALILAMSVALLPMTAMAATGPVKVGDTEYATFAAALTAVPDGGTIDLVVDTNVTVNTTINKSIIINTNGYDLTFDRRLILAENMIVTINGDITVIGATADDGYIDEFLLLNYGAKLTVTGDVTLTRGGIKVMGVQGYPQWSGLLTVGGNVVVVYGIVLEGGSMSVGGDVTFYTFIWGAAAVVDGGTMTIDGAVLLHEEVSAGDSYPYFKLGYLWDSWNVKFVTDLTNYDRIVDGYEIFGYPQVNPTSVVRLKHVHIYDAVETLPTCTADGFTTYTCVCGHVYTDDIVPALGHAYVAVSATVSSTNLQDKTTVTITVYGNCSMCGDFAQLASQSVKLKQNGTQIVKIGAYSVTVVVNGNNKITGIFV